MRLRLAVAPAARAAVSAAFAAVTAVSCGGGATSPTDPLNMRQAPVSGMDPPPRTGDTPPSMFDTPPSTYDPPPSMDDPANGGGSGGCFPCSGTFTCTAPGGTGSTTYTLAVDSAKDGCVLTPSTNTTSTIQIPATPACRTNIPFGGTGEYVFTRTSGGGVTVCVDLDGGEAICGTCLPTSANAPAGSGSGTSVPVVGAGASTCSALSTCCNALPSADQSGCQAIASSEVQATCSSVLSGYEATHLCP